MSSEAEAFKFQLIQEATAGRATSMNLIGAVCELYSGEEAVERGFIDEVLRSKDGDVPVRAEAAVALSSLAKIAPVQHICEMVSLLVSFTKWTDKSQLPLFEQFMTDEFDLVRQSVCLSLPALCRRIESPDYRRYFAVKAVKALTESGEDVRCAALEILGEVIYIFKEDPRGPPIELLNTYMEDRRVEAIGEETDWDVVASFNVNHYLDLRDRIDGRVVPWSLSHAGP